MKKVNFLTSIGLGLSLLNASCGYQPPAETSKLRTAQRVAASDEAGSHVALGALSAPLADPSGINKCRFISFVLPAESQSTALRVWMVSLHHVVPPYRAAPSIPFTSFEGQAVWVGPPVSYVESTSNPATFYAAQTQCTPHYQDWSTIGLLHVTGSHIVPSSIYDVQQVSIDCQGQEETCANLSPTLEVHTTRWSDVVAPFNPPDDTEQPSFGDCNSAVDKFKSTSSAPIKARTLLAGIDAFGTIDIDPDLSFTHVVATVDAFRGFPYPYTIQPCP